MGCRQTDLKILQAGRNALIQKVNNNSRGPIDVREPADGVH